MAVELAEHIHQMTNAELNGVAKLRFTDEATQVAIAQHPYLLCRKYLALNPQLCGEARDLLLAGKAKSVRLNLLSSGHLDDCPEKISELYFAYKQGGKVGSLSWWRLNPFVRRGWWWRKDQAEDAPPNTPLEVLEDIHQTLTKASERLPANGSSGNYASYNSRTLVDAVRHPNSSERMAVIASTNPEEVVRQAGFERLVALEKERVNEN